MVLHYFRRCISVSITTTFILHISLNGFSWATTNMLHRYPDQSEFDIKMQRADLEFLRDNDSAQKVFAENYVGLPY